MLSTNPSKILGAITLLALAAGCSAATEPSDRTADVDLDSLDTQQIVYSTNADGTWSEDAQPPSLDPDYYTGTASAVFTGPAGKTRKMGVCLLRATSTLCSSISDCGSVAVPTGGAMYCTQKDGSGTGQKYCAFRPGTQADFCAGSPAYADHHAIAPGTYTTLVQSVAPGKPYISYACFEACSATDPSSSSASRTDPVISQYCIRYPNDPSCFG